MLFIFWWRKRKGQNQLFASVVTFSRTNNLLLDRSTDTLTHSLTHSHAETHFKPYRLHSLSPSPHRFTAQHFDQEEWVFVLLAMTISPAPSACLRFVQRICRGFQSASGHDSLTIPQLSVTHATPGVIHATFRIAPYNLNRLGTLHGGCIATLTDTVGSLAIASHGLYSTGVSTDLNTTYVKSAGGAGDHVTVKGEVISMGKTLAFTRMELRHPVTDALLAYGSHTKFIGRALTHAENVRFDGQGEKVIKGKQPEDWSEESKM